MGSSGGGQQMALSHKCGGTSALKEELASLVGRDRCALLWCGSAHGSGPALCSPNVEIAQSPGPGASSRYQTADGPVQSLSSEHGWHCDRSDAGAPLDRVDRLSAQGLGGDGSGAPEVGSCAHTGDIRADCGVQIASASECSQGKERPKSSAPVISLDGKSEEDEKEAFAAVLRQS